MRKLEVDMVLESGSGEVEMVILKDLDTGKRESYSYSEFINYIIGSKVELYNIIKNGDNIEFTESVAKTYLNTGSMRGIKVVNGLRALEKETDVAKDLEPRDIVESLVDVVDKRFELLRGNICTISGIRRTGKTIAVMHTIKELIDKGYDASKIYYIDILDNTVDTDRFMEYVMSLGDSVVFIDEITNLENIINRLRCLSDTSRPYFIVTGTDSYVFPVARKDTMYLRTIDFRTSYMSFREFIRIFKNRIEGKSKREKVMEYIKTHGVMSDRAFRGDREILNTLDTSIINNIINTIERNALYYKHKSTVSLLEKYSKEELRYYLISVIINSSNIVGNDESIKAVDVDSYIEMLFRGELEGIEVKDRVSSIGRKINREVLSDIRNVLVNLGIIGIVDNFCPDGIEGKGIVVDGRDYYYLKLAGLKYGIVKSITESKRRVRRGRKESGLDSFEEFDGSLLETVIFQACESLELDNYIVYADTLRYKSEVEGDSSKNPEVDIVVYSNAKVDNSKDFEYKELPIVLIEVKMSSSPKSSHAKNLYNPSIDIIMEEYGYDSVKRVVVYNGETQKIRETHYINAYDFLVDTKNCLYGEYIRE